MASLAVSVHPVLDRFVQSVRAMRALQKSYFCARNPQTLAEARRAEADVDRQLRRILDGSAFRAQATFAFGSADEDRPLPI